ncbi:uncharacterized protein O3C94_018982 [Discoglossus pictus]
MEAVQILLELKKRTYKDISDFIVEFNNVLEKKQIQYLADDIIVGLIFDTVWNQVSSRVQSSEDFQDWFTNKLKLVLSGATPSVISNISMDIDCSSQSAIVQGFSDVMEELSDDQIKIIVSRIKKYQTDMAEITGSACDSDKSSLEWIVSTCGQFKEYFSLADLKDLNKNFSEVAALPECTGSQIAEYVGSDRVLENKKLIITALNNLNTFDKVEDFYTKLNTMAAIWDPTAYYQLTFVHFLPPHRLHGFNNVYENMKDTSRQMIYDKVIKLQFNKTTSVSGSGCVSPGAKTQYWIDSNIGAFSVKAEYSDMMQWNEKFVATDVIEIFTARQLADMLVQSKKLNDEELLCQILGRLKHANISDVYMFLDRFNENIQKLSYTELLSETVRYKMLSESLLLIQDRLHLYSIIDWERLLSVRLQPFLSSITKVQLDIFLTYADYRIYAIIVKQLSKVFNDILADVRYSLYQSLFTFRSGKQFTGTFYPGSGENSKTRLELDFGKFISLVSYSDLLAIYPNLYGLDIIDILSAEQCARLIFDCDILNNETNANIFANKLQTFSFSEIDIFLTHFQTNANQRSLTFLKNGQIRTMFWNVIFSIVKGQFQNFTTTQWTDYWQYKLIVFIPSLNETQLDFMTSLTCEFFQITMAGLNKVYSKTPESTQKAIFQAAYTFLSAKNNSTGSACAANTQGSHGWLLTNFGYYSYYATYANFITLNAKFIATDTLSSLSVEQLAEYTLSSDTLKSIDKMTLIFSQLNVKNIGIFMDKFNLVASKMQLTELSSVEVNRFMLEKIIYILGSSFASFSIQEYTLWFRYRLKFFIIYFSTNIFASLPKNIGCEKLALLVNIFSNYTNNENPKDIYTFILSRLKSQVTPSGNACVNGTVSGKLWFVTYFGAFTTFLKWTDIIPVYSTIQVDDATGFLKEDDLYSIALSGSLAITVVSFYDFLAKIRGHAGILYTYIDQLRNYVTQVRRYLWLILYC